MSTPTLRERSAAFAALGDPVRLRIVDELRHSDRTPGELAGVADLPTNLLAHHLTVLERAGLVARSRSEGDGRRRYVTLVTNDPTSLWYAPSEPIDSVTFVCTHNSARSQFAAARWQQLTGEPADSAGTDPAAAVHPLAVEAAREFRLDLSLREPHGYDHLGWSDTVISVCDRALEAGLPPHRRHLHWSIPDPVPSNGVDTFAAAFRAIDRRITRLARSQGRG